MNLTEWKRLFLANYGSGTLIERLRHLGERERRLLRLGKDGGLSD